MWPSTIRPRYPGGLPCGYCSPNPQGAGGERQLLRFGLVFFVPALENAFLEKLLAAPEDDLTRAGYADWLEETGQETHAEFLRRLLPRTPGNIARARPRLSKVDAAWRAVIEEMEAEVHPRLRAGNRPSSTHSRRLPRGFRASTAEGQGRLRTPLLAC